MDPFVESEIKRVTPMLAVEYGPSKCEKVKYYTDGSKYTMTFWFGLFFFGLESYKGGVCSYLAQLKDAHTPEELFCEDGWFDKWRYDEILERKNPDMVVIPEKCESSSIAIGTDWAPAPVVRANTPPSLQVFIKNCTHCDLDFKESPIVWSFARDLHLCEKCMAQAIRNALKK